MPLNGEHDQKYQRYIDNKLHAQGYANATWKTPEQWQKAIDFWKRSKDKGDRFRDGMTLLRNQTPQYGYEVEVHVRTPEGSRYHDARHVATGDSSEYKAGAVSKERSLPQLNKDEREMQAGNNVDWTVVQGARIDRETQARMAQLQREYPEQFRVYVVSKDVQRLALTIGKHKEKERQREALAQRREARELAEQLRQQQAPRDLAKRREELIRTVQQAEKDIADRFERARETNTQPPSAQELADTHKSLVREKRAIERGDKKQAQKLVNDLKLTPRQREDMVAYLAERREEGRERTGVTAGLEQIGALAREAEAREKAEAQEAEQKRVRDREFLEKQQRAREARDKAELAPEIGTILDAGNPLPSQHVRDGRSDHRLSGAREQEGRGRDLYRDRN